MQFRFIYDYFTNHYYNPQSRTVIINLTILSRLVRENEKDFHIFLNDLIEHETLHYVIHKHIGLKECTDFDLIAQTCRSNTKIQKVLERLELRFMTREEIKQRMNGR